LHLFFRVLSHPQVAHYQEQPQLLDQVLEGLVKPLAGLLLSLAGHGSVRDNDEDITNRFARSSRFLWQLSVVRGYKIVLRFFPNEVAALEPVVDMLTFFAECPKDGALMLPDQTANL